MRAVCLGTSRLRTVWLGISQWVLSVNRGSLAETGMMTFLHVLQVNFELH